MHDISRYCIFTCGRPNIDLSDCHKEVAVRARQENSISYCFVALQFLDQVICKGEFINDGGMAFDINPYLKF